MSEILNKIHWLGHSGFRVEGSKTVYFDPYNIAGGPTADLILVSHTHYDHFSPNDIKKVSDGNTTLVISSDANPDFAGEVIKLVPGKTVDAKGMTIKGVPAYNVGKQFHPKANGWLGYLLTIDNDTIYHTGDTDLIPEMNGIKADVALVPVGGTFTMDAAEAAKAVKAMGVKAAIPMHWGEIVGDESDARRFKELVGDAAEVVILKKE
ncbi:MAG: MBL fold metallo-hydrolase [Deltaproteobacteria bacterium]|uniref:MBL fold metallo-hydrolase n=1 Tax=Candidatus Zymogenus saltonus TaxID=2844893 RepID=A0A9D8KJH1_9DELT|nr:MBL fold metallo-hydrolase [Candidatus Zymogenus saltonus]